jgi:hypothetical protein
MIDISNAARDRVTTDRVTTEGVEEALEAVGRLRDAVSDLDLPGDVMSRAGWVVDDMEDELCRPDPDRDVMASRLWRLTEFLQGEGAVIEPGTSLLAAIASVAAWVGPLGEALLRRLR